MGLGQPIPDKRLERRWPIRTYILDEPSSENGRIRADLTWRWCADLTKRWFLISGPCQPGPIQALGRGLAVRHAAGPTNEIPQSRVGLGPPGGGLYSVVLAISEFAGLGHSPIPLFGPHLVFKYIAYGPSGMQQQQKQRQHAQKSSYM